MNANTDPKPDFPDMAEEFVISGMLDPQTIPLILQSGLTAEDFYVPARKILFREACDLYSQDRHFDPITFYGILDKKGYAEAIGGRYGFMDLLTKYIDELKWGNRREQHIESIKAAARRRRAAVKLSESLEKLRNGEDAAFGEIQQTLLAAQESRKTSKAMPLTSFAKKVIVEIDKECAAHTYITGVRSGHFRLDALTAGFQPGNVYVIAARPAMGKTSLALDIMRNIAAKQPETRLLFVSAEMSGKAIMRRMIGAEAGLDLREAVCNITEGQKLKINNAIIRINERKNSRILEAQALDIDQLAALIRYEHDLQPIDVLFIDYLQMIHGTTQRAALSSVEQINEVSQKLHALAITLDIPIVLLAQVNRDASGKNPAIHDLKGSGAIEQDADVVILLDRPEVYADAAMPENYLAAIRGLAVLDVAKNRNGATGKVCLTFQPATQTFIDRAEQSVPVLQTSKRKPNKYHLATTSRP